MDWKYLHNTILYLLLAAVILSACDRNAHEGEFPLPDGKGGLICGLVSEDNDIEVRNAHLLVFGGDDKLVAHEYFDEAKNVALHMEDLPGERYTVLAVLNMPENLLELCTRAALPDITLPAFIEWLRKVAPGYPDLLTAVAYTEVAEGEITRITLTLRVGVEGIDLPTLHLLFTLPEPHLPDYVTQAKSRAAEAGYALRCIVEVCKAGTEEVVHRKAYLPQQTTEGRYPIDLSLNKATYDIRLWTDYVPANGEADDYHYITTNGLQAVTIQTEPYTANTDTKDAAYAFCEAVALQENKTIEVALQRPLAKYRLIATDVEEYNKLREQEPEKFPPPEELTVTVAYENFLPSTFDVVNGKPTSSLTGITFTGKPYAADGITREIPLATDWIIVNGTDSSVRVTIRLSDKKGNLLGTTTGCPIAYRRGCLTTVRGKFLTAGIGNGGVSIDTEWEDSFVVEF